MYRKLIKPFGLFLLLALAGLFPSCQKEDTLSDVENFVLQCTNDIEERTGTGLAGCYELVFPVTIQFADSTTAEVGDYDELKQAIREWFLANGGRPRPWNRPTLVLPIQVINEAGEVITVETPEELKELRALCNPGHGHGGPGGGHHGGGGPCFTLAFPITLAFPDSTQVTVNSKEEFRVAIKTWNDNNPGKHVHPQFVFPITVTLRDGTLVTVNSKEELRALKEDCRG